MIRVQIGSAEPRILNDLEMENFRKELDIVALQGGSYSVLRQNKSHEISILKTDPATKIITLSIDGIKTDITLTTKLDLLLEKMGINLHAAQKLTTLKSPMPGLVLDIFIAEGDEVKAGDKLMILEAMKMENVIKSSGEGKVKNILINKGVAVEKNQALIEFC